MKLLLDTHVVLWWWTDDPSLPQPWAATIEETMDAGDVVSVSAITLWEIAMLADRGRIRVAASIDAFIDDIEHHPAVRVIPLGGRIAVESVRLGDGYPRDPADRIIGATARLEGLRLMTADDRIRKSGLVPIA